MKIYTDTALLTRVEGHSSVKLIQIGNRVVEARMYLHESPRLFEALLVGKRFDEISDIACRICSICSTVHKVAALQAVESAAGTTVTQQTRMLRELAVHGGQIESHALYIFCLALPDYLGISGIQELADRDIETVKTGLRIKKTGNLIQEIVGGRAIHPFNLLLGGMGRVPSTGQLRTLARQLAALRTDLSSCISSFFALNEILPSMSPPDCCAVSGGPPLFGVQLTTSSGDIISSANAAAWFNEKIVPPGHAKVSKFTGSKTFIVGPLARIKLSPATGYAASFSESSITASFKARIIELQLSIERSMTLIEQLLTAGLKNEPPLTGTSPGGTGTALIEAPRGLLLHSYSFNQQGVCTAANIITPTAINQGAIAASLQELITIMDGAEYEQIKAAAETLIRCYDPCFSCAVH